VQVRGLVDEARTRWGADLAEWGLADRHALLIAAAPVALAVVGILAVPFRSAYRVLANEDGIAEWLQVVLLVTLLFLYAWTAVALWRSGRRGYASLFVLAAAGVLFIAGEEISWGQRIFGWATPEGLEDINNQGESNIHNIGPILRIFNLAVMAVSGAAVLLPLARWTIWRERARTLPGYLFVPPLALLPAFAFPFAYRAIRYLVLPEPRYVITKYAEIAELSFYVGLTVLAFLTLRAIGRRDDHAAADDGPRGASPTGSS
jgi:hypothetical protein